MSGKWILITGASSGIGEQIALEAARAGFGLVLSARNQKGLEEVAKKALALGAASHIFPGDLGDKEFARDLWQKTRDAIGAAPDYLVNNAGFGTYGAFIDNPLENDSDMLALNVMALTVLSKLAARDFVARGSGGILNVASAAGFVPGPYMAVYYASKAFVLNFSLALSAELAPLGVTVTALCPGPVKTPFIQRAGVGKLAVFKKAATAEQIGKTGFNAMIKGKVLVLPTMDVKLNVTASRFLPRRTLLWFMTRMQKARKP